MRGQGENHGSGLDHLRLADQLKTDGGEFSLDPLSLDPSSLQSYSLLRASGAARACTLACVHPVNRTVWHPFAPVRVPTEPMSTDHTVPPRSLNGGFINQMVNGKRQAADEWRIAQEGRSQGHDHVEARNKKQC